jgi:acylphosphatase
MATARHVIVTGRVQGVFYRAWTKGQADGLGVSGWIRNRPDGSVEAHVEGEAAAVGQLIERMQSGPPAANVAALALDEVEPVGIARFEVRSGG